MNNEEIKQWFADHNRLYSATIELTQSCNFHCKHCYCSEKTTPPLPVHDLLKIIDKIYETGCLVLSFTGGEILTYNDFETVYIYAKEKGFLVDLLTNGSLLSEKHFEIFKKYPPRLIAITLYGTNEQEYNIFTGDGQNFYKVMRNLEILKNSHLNFGLKTLATKDFKNSILAGKFDQIAEYFNTKFYYSPVIFPKVSGDETPMLQCLDVEEIVHLEENTPLRKQGWIDKINENKKRNFEWICYAGISTLTVDIHGNAYVCTLFRKDPISILDNPISDVLNHLRTIHNRHIKIVETNECSQCKYRKNCKWCPVYSYIYNHNETDKIKFFCDLTKVRMSHFDIPN